MAPLAKRELVGRIIASKYFHRSERLSSFLQHICELEIQGRVSEINEKDIGRTVFLLPTDYDPSIDGIVRSHASRLRRKLETYYLNEGRQETIRLVIPRGAYQPRFEPCVPDCGTLEVGASSSEEPEEEDVSAYGAGSQGMASEQAETPGRRRMLWIGAAYVAWIGYGMWRSEGASLPAAEAARRSRWTTFRRGAVTCLRNPKAYLFMRAVLPQCIRRENGLLWPQALTLGLVIVITQLAIYGALACAAGGAQAWLTERPAYARMALRVVGALLIGIALLTMAEGVRRLM